MCFCDIQLYNMSHIYSFWSGNGNEHFLVWEWEWTRHSQMSIRRGYIQHHWRDTLAAVKWGTLRKREVTPIFVARYFSCAMWFHDYVTLFYTLNGHIVNSAVGEHRKWPWEHMFAVNKYYVYSQSMGGYLHSRHTFLFKVHLLCAEAPLGCSKLEASPQKTDTDNWDRYFKTWPIMSCYANNMHFWASLHTCNVSLPWVM